MCGIFGYLGDRDDAAQVVFSGLKRLEYRGYDSWGVACIPKDDGLAFISEKHVGKIGSSVLKNQQASGLAIGHTRWATHGGVTDINAHPHFDSKREIAVVHNGIVENYQTLKSMLMKKGYVCISQTDTEVVAHCIADHMKKFPFREAVRHAFLKLDGLNAFVVANKKTQELVAIRKGSPLAIGQSKDGMYIASDAVALSEYVKNVYFLDDDDMVIFDTQKVTLMNVQTGKRKRIVWQALDIKVQDLHKGKFDHFMIKEIMEQPALLALISKQLHPQIRAYARLLTDDCAFSGCGSAYHACVTATYLFSSIAGKHALAIIGSEFGYHLKFINPKIFTTFVSQSGETIDIVEHAQELKKKKVAFGAIVNRLGSTLERMTHTKILLSVGPEQCVLATKSFTAKLAVLFLLAHELVGTYEKGENELRIASKAISELLTPRYVAKHIQVLAKKLMRSKHIFVIGRGLSYPMAMEAALKIKEVTYIHAEGFAGGDLKHGAIALIEKGTPCIVFAPADETFSCIMSNAMELKSRGAFIIGVSEKNNQIFDAHIPVRDVGPCTMLGQSIVIQVLAYHLAVMLGNDPDKPRNLAKSVVVR